METQRPQEGKQHETKPEYLRKLKPLTPTGTKEQSLIPRQINVKPISVPIIQHIMSNFQQKITRQPKRQEKPQCEETKVSIKIKLKYCRDFRMIRSGIQNNCD